MNAGKAKGESQRDKFIKKARELGCDEDEKIFNEKLKKIIPKNKKNGNNKQEKT